MEPTLLTVRAIMSPRRAAHFAREVPTNADPAIDLAAPRRTSSRALSCPSEQAPPPALRSARKRRANGLTQEQQALKDRVVQLRCAAAIANAGATSRSTALDANHLEVGWQDLVISNTLLIDEPIGSITLS